MTIVNARLGQRFQDRRRALAAADAHGLELATSWLLARPCVASVIVGATSDDQVVTRSSTQWEIPDDVTDEVDRLAQSWQ